MSEPQVLRAADLPLSEKRQDLFQVISAVQELDPRHATKHRDGDTLNVEYGWAKIARGHSKQLHETYLASFHYLKDND